MRLMTTDGELRGRRMRWRVVEHNFPLGSVASPSLPPSLHSR